MLKKDLEIMKLKMKLFSFPVECIYKLKEFIINISHKNIVFYC